MTTTPQTSPYPGYESPWPGMTDEQNDARNRRNEITYLRREVRNAWEHVEHLADELAAAQKRARELQGYLDFETDGEES